MIEVISPAGLERFFRDLVEITDVRRPEPAEVGEIAGRYGMPFADPAWLPDIIERYGLTPPRR
jgi:hypothetical protein